MRQSALGGIGCRGRLLGGATTTASVFLASAYAARSLSARKGGNRSPRNIWISDMPEASQRATMFAPCGISEADLVTSTRDGVHSLGRSSRGESLEAALASVVFINYVNVPPALRVPRA